MSKDIARLFARRFIQRSDVKAVQMSRDGGTFHAGDWFPDTKINADKNPNSPHLPVGFSMPHLLAHLGGERTYGHYLLGADDTCKLFAFDIDLNEAADPELNETRSYVKLPKWDALPEEIAGLDDGGKREEEWYHENTTVIEGVNPRELWQARDQTARAWYKYQMKVLAHMLASKVRELGIDCAAAYSGSKGVHVYGFTGALPASEVREAALLVLDMVDEFEPTKKGTIFWNHKNDDPVHGFKQNFTIEVFPKQDSLKDKSLGNLMRLPMGKNWKNPKDPCFFLDMTGPLAEFKPHADPVKLLESGDPYA